MIHEHLLRKQGSNSFISAEARRLELLQHFKFGIDRLDELIALYPGSLTLFQGDIPRHILREFFTNLSVSLLLTNPEAEIAFVDGANIFPYFEISVESKSRGIDPFLILDRIQLSRAFNYHQVTEILTKQLPKLIEEKPEIRFVLIPQISSLHLSEEAAQYLTYDKQPVIASLFELTSALGVLKQLSMRYDLVGIVTAANAPYSKQKALGGTYLAHTATTIIHVETIPTWTRKDYGLVFTLLQDPAKPVSEILIPSNPKGEEGQPIPLTKFW
jgi:hypothetical protein